MNTSSRELSRYRSSTTLAQCHRPAKRPRVSDLGVTAFCSLSETATFSHEDCSSYVSRNRSNAETEAFPREETLKEAFVCVFRYMAGSTRSTVLTSRAYQQARDIATLASVCVSARQAFSEAFDAIDIKADDAARWRNNGCVKQELSGCVLASWCRLLKRSLLRFSCTSESSEEYRLCHLEEFLLSLSTCSRLQYLALDVTPVPYELIMISLNRLGSSLLTLHLPNLRELFVRAKDRSIAGESLAESVAPGDSIFGKVALSNSLLNVANMDVSRSWFSVLNLRAVTVHHNSKWSLADFLDVVGAGIVELRIISSPTGPACLADMQLASLSASVPKLSCLKLERFQLSADCISSVVERCANLDCVALTNCRFLSEPEFDIVLRILGHRLIEYSGSPTLAMLSSLLTHSVFVERLSIGMFCSCKNRARLFVRCSTPFSLAGVVELTLCLSAFFVGILCRLRTPAMLQLRQDFHGVARVENKACLGLAQFIVSRSETLKHLTLSRGDCQGFDMCCSRACREDELGIILSLIVASQDNALELEHLGLRGFSSLTVVLLDSVLQATGNSLKSIDLDGCWPVSNVSAAVVLSRYARHLQSVVAFPRPWELSTCDSETLHLLDLVSTRCPSLCLQAHLERVRDCLPSGWDDDEPENKKHRVMTEPPSTCDSHRIDSWSSKFDQRSQMSPITT